ncbi:hypothetical protein H2200_003085 [Cladophialophora chaetospira]|uniref:Uncharacterized protein n=1 Tax=Cladophialophora chaetospira TaxID=386627 RepID=A0AA39CL49_9EURO|nr:hypothetical protein H2200_003085 [Cladophialophora chaetospira]
MATSEPPSSASDAGDTGNAMIDYDPGLGLLGRLPREIRDRIYEMYFERTELKWDLNSARQHPGLMLYPKRYPRNLLMASEDICAEARRFEYHDLCLVVWHREAWYPEVLAQRARHVRFEPGLVVTYEWLEDLLMEGCMEKLLDVIRPQLDWYPQLPQFFAKNTTEPSGERMQWLAVLRCRIITSDQPKSKLDHVDVVLHIAANPLRVEYVQYKNYRCPVLQNLKERRTFPDDLPARKIPPLDPFPKPWPTVDTLARYAQVVHRKIDPIRNFRSLNADACAAELEELLSHQRRRYAWPEIEFPVVGDGESIYARKRRFQWMKIDYRRRFAETLRAIGKATVRFVTGGKLGGH